MRTREPDAIQEFLKSHKSFSECVIETMGFEHFGTTLAIRMDYIYDSNGSIRRNLDEPNIVSFAFKIVQEVHIYNRLNQIQSSNPELLNWGFNEVSRVILVEDSKLLENYRDLPVPFSHVSFQWEGKKSHIEIVFSEFEVASAG